MKIKLLLVIIYLLLALGALCSKTLVETALLESVKHNNINPLPDLALINDLDRVIQERFLTNPNFGVRRIGPNPNPHLEYFEPLTEQEKQAVANLQNGQWKVGVYLIGRRAYEKSVEKDKEGKKRLLIQYKLNNPLPVTKNAKKRELADPKRLRDAIDEAFQRFKKTDSYDFELGKWSYVARPARARESCLRCHTDFFVTSKLSEKSYAYRSRRVGIQLVFLCMPLLNLDS